MKKMFRCSALTHCTPYLALMVDTHFEAVIEKAKSPSFGLRAGKWGSAQNKKSDTSIFRAE